MISYYLVIKMFWIIKMKRLTAILISISAIGSANAVDYELPSGSNVAFAQLQSLIDFSTLCDSGTVTDNTCNVESGDYQLVVFDSAWQADISVITVEAGDTDDVGVTLVTESCFGGPNTRSGCTAFCPSGTLATGGACDVSNGFSVSSVAGQTFYRCPTALPPNDTSVGVTASVYCLRLQ